MLREEILKQFQKHPELKILFFFDPSPESEEQVNNVQLEGIRLVKYANNPLELKVLLNGEWSQEKIFLYVPLKSPSTQDEYHRFPLLDLLTANRELRLDDVAEFIDEYHLQPHHEPLVHKYMRELKYARVHEVLAEILIPGLFNEENLIQGLVASFLDFPRFVSWDLIIGKLFSLSNSEKQDLLRKFIRKLDENKLLDRVIHQVKLRTGQVLESLSQESLTELVQLVKYNVMTLNILNVKKEDTYRHLKITDPSLLVRLKLFHETCINEGIINTAYLEALEVSGTAVRENLLADLYARESFFSWYNRSLYIETVRKWLPLIPDQPESCFDVFSRLSMVEIQDNELKTLTSFLIWSSEIFHRIQKAGSLIYDKPEDYFENYTTDLYKIDRAYRKAVWYYYGIDETRCPELDLPSVKDKLEDVYFKYADGLNRNWLSCFEEKDFDLHSLRIPTQYKFFKTYLEGSEQKLAVIISDGLRYEIGNELLAELHADPKNEAGIQYMVTSLPSKTSTGMASLLPEGKMELKDGVVFLDGLSSAGLKERETLLDKKLKGSKAVGYNTIISQSKEQNRELFKSPLVFVYHDTIDAIGDDRKTEKKTFSAVQDAINELKKLINQLHHTHNVSKVIVTSDHGFLYNDKVIGEMEKESISGKDADEVHPRYVLMTSKHPSLSGYFIPLRKVSTLDDNRFIMVSTGINRYKVQGAGQQYVHGGASLQEIIVPVIVSTRKRVAVIDRVDPVLSQRDLRIVSNMLRIKLVQKEPVSKTRKERHIVVGLYHGNQLVSNQAEMVMASGSDLPADRIYSIDLVLKSDSGDHEVLKLKVFDRGDILNPLIEENVINTTIIKRDF